MNEEQKHICVVEDNDTMRLGISETLQRDGFTVSAYASGQEALDFLRQRPVPLVITDLRMKPLDGLELLKKVKQTHPETEVLLISAYGTVQDAVTAMQLGAADFLTKPFSPDELRVRVRKIAEKIENARMLDQLKEHNRYLEQEISGEYDMLVGQSEAMRRVLELIDRVAGQDSTVLIQGESGTGKELAARAIHNKSPRRRNPFIKVNCAALNDNLLESELFGHEKGSFTGAVRRKKGRFELADGGTLFLDEIGDISPATQVKLLRVLQEKEFERVGGEQTLHVNVRILAATNRDLNQLIEQGKFREDLYYRLNVIPLRLPPLRERKEDIPLLVHHFLKKLNTSKTIEPQGMELFKMYPWPGNIRELENLIERLVVISPKENIPATLIAHALEPQSASGHMPETLNLNDALYQFEKKLIVEAMKKANGVKNQAARLLGIRTSALYYKLEKFGLLK